MPVDVNITVPILREYTHTELLIKMSSVPSHGGPTHPATPPGAKHGAPPSGLEKENDFRRLKHVGKL